LNETLFFYYRSLTNELNSFATNGDGVLPNIASIIGGISVYILWRLRQKGEKVKTRA